MNERGSNNKHCRDCGEPVGDYWLVVGYATTSGHQPTRCQPCVKAFQVLKDRERRGAIIGDTRRCVTCGVEFVAKATRSVQCPAHVNLSATIRARIRAAADLGSAE
jgi:DNA-directed RNA polymerase subunit RPC12/RpoP